MPVEAHTRRHRSALVAVTLAAFFVTGAHAQQTERITLDGNAVAVYNLAGAVTIEGGSGANVVVEVTRGGADASSLGLDRRNVDGKSSLIVRYPDRSVIYNEGNRGSGSRTTINVRADGTFYGDGPRGERVEIRGSGSGTRAHADLRIIVPAGRSVDVRLGVGTVTATNVAGDLDIDVGASGVTTRSTRGRLRIDTGSGRVNVTDAEGSLLVDTGSGSVQVENVHGDDVSIDTGSGAVTGGGVTAGRLHVDTGSGSVTLKRVTARDIEVDTGSGRVDLELLSDVDRVVIDTGSGGVRLAVPQNLGAAFEVDANGSIGVDVPANFSERERGYVRGTIGDGRGSIKIDTGSGRVSIVGS